MRHGSIQSHFAHILSIVVFRNGSHRATGNELDALEILCAIHQNCLYERSARRDTLSTSLDSAGVKSVTKVLPHQSSITCHHRRGHACPRHIKSTTGVLPDAAIGGMNVITRSYDVRLRSTIVSGTTRRPRRHVPQSHVVSAVQIFFDALTASNRKGVFTVDRVLDCSRSTSSVTGRYNVEKIFVFSR